MYEFELICGMCLRNVLDGFGAYGGRLSAKMKCALIPNMMHLLRDSVNAQHLFQMQREAN